MDEYIEREALRDSVESIDWYSVYRGKLITGANSENALYKANDIYSAIDNAPAADVAPVRHARWVDNHCTACGMMPMGDEMWKLCDFDPPRFERFMDYCPNCGARMDGGAE